jgi:carboxymethylenebutenolidase
VVGIQPVALDLAFRASEPGPVVGSGLRALRTVSAPAHGPEVDDLCHRTNLPRRTDEDETMGSTITLTADDGHSFSAYQAGFEDAPRALVVVQEIFGVNHHIRAVADGFADAGYRVIAPALFDRAERNVELDYDQAGMQKGIALKSAIPNAQSLADLLACAKALGHEKVGIIGYCWGGSLAWSAATTTDTFAVAVGWYGGEIAQTAGATPRCPVQLHFGADDDHIPATAIDTIRAAHPEMEIFVYDGAGHGFGCSERGSYNAGATALAQDRTLAFLQHAL